MVKLYFTRVNYYVTTVTFFDSKKAGVVKKNFYLGLISYNADDQGNTPPKTADYQKKYILL